MRLHGVSAVARAPRRVLQGQQTLRAMPPHRYVFLLTVLRPGDVKTPRLRSIRALRLRGEPFLPCSAALAAPPAFSSGPRAPLSSPRKARGLKKTFSIRNNAK